MSTEAGVVQLPEGQKAPFERDNRRRGRHEKAQCKSK